MSRPDPQFVPVPTTIRGGLNAQYDHLKSREVFIRDILVGPMALSGSDPTTSTSLRTPPSFARISRVLASTTSQAFRDGTQHPNFATKMIQSATVLMRQKHPRYLQNSFWRTISMTVDP